MIRIQLPPRTKPNTFNTSNKMTNERAQGSRVRTRAERRKPTLDPHTMMHVYKTEDEMHMRE